MPYIGYNVTNAGSFALIDDIASTFNGSNTAFTLQVGGVNITPNVQNLIISIDGVVQQAPDAYSVSGSTITFTEAPASGADFYGILMGQSSYVENNSITADELAVSGDGSSGQLLSSDGDGTFSWLSSSSITSVGTLTSLTVDNISVNGTTIGHTSDTDLLTFASSKLTVAGDVKVDGGNALLLREDDTYINSPSSDKIDFRTGGSVAMTIDTNQHIGIGTTSPYDDSWGGTSKQLTISGSGFGVLNLIDTGTPTRYAIGAGSGNHYLSYDDVNSRHNLTINSSGNATFAGNITQSKDGNLRLTQTAGGNGESSLVLTANNSTGDSFVRWETNQTTFCIGLDNSDGDKFIISAGSDPHSNSVINIQPDGSNIAIDKITSFNAPAVFNGGSISGSLSGISSSGVGGDLMLYANGSAYARVESSGDFRVVNGLRVDAGDSSQRARLHWHHFKTTLDRRYYHFHTNISYGTSTQMYSLHFLGHAYNDSKAINTTLAFYNYDNGSVLAIGSTGTHSATVYESANDKIVLVLDLGAGNTYYSGLTISSYHTAQGVANFSITEQGVSNNATGVY